MNAQFTSLVILATLPETSGSYEWTQNWTVCKLLDVKHVRHHFDATVSMLLIALNTADRYL
jgi:hypothetical protein